MAIVKCKSLATGLESGIHEHESESVPEDGRRERSFQRVMEKITTEDPIRALREGKGRDKRETGRETGGDVRVSQCDYPRGRSLASLQI